MSKAEERALEQYPIEMYEEAGWRCVDKNADKRKYFVEGYKQAKEEMISKAFEWLKFNLQDYQGEDSYGNSVSFDKGIFEDFKHAMKDEVS